MVTALDGAMATLTRRGQTGAMDPVVRRLRPEEASGISTVGDGSVPRAVCRRPRSGRRPRAVGGQARASIGRGWSTPGTSFAGNAGIYSLDVTLPGAPGRPCPTIPMAGVTAVGVHPTHRRRGFLRQLMAAMHDDARQRGEAIAGLEASESIIYGRFGYGLAANLAEYSIDSRSSAFAVPAPALDLALVDKDEAVKVLPEIFDRQRRTRAGEVNRSAGYWTQLLADRPASPPEPSARFHAVCDEGYVLYRATAEANVFQGDRVNILVEELRGDTPEVEAALWRFVLDLDLVGQVNGQAQPGGRAGPLASGRSAPAADRQYRGPALRQDPGHRRRLRGPRLPGRGPPGARRAATGRVGGRGRRRHRAGGCSRPDRRAPRAAGPVPARTPTSASVSPPSAPSTWAASRPHSLPPVGASRS